MMLESMYDRGMRAQDDRSALRMLVLATLAVAVLTAGVLLYPINDVLHLEGLAAPAQVIPLVAHEDIWIRLQPELHGRQITAGEVIGTFRYELNEEPVTQAIQRQEQVIGASTDPTQKALAQVELQRLTALLGERPLLADGGGTVMAVYGGDHYGWFPKGRRFAELYDPQELEIHAPLGERQDLKPEQVSRVTIRPARGGQAFPGQLQRVTTEPGEHGLQAVAELRPDGFHPLRPGQDYIVHLVGPSQRLGARLVRIFFPAGPRKARH